MPKRKLPKHLKELIANFDKGLGRDGKPLTDAQRRAGARLVGATHYQNKSGKIIKLRK
jgi:hypothetical protein